MGRMVHLNGTIKKIFEEEDLSNQTLKDLAVELIGKCEFSNGVMRVSASSKNLSEIYDLFRISVLDGHIPINKAIGFKLFSSMHMEDVAAIERHTSCLENMVELSKNVSKVVFMSPTGFVVNSGEKTGNVTAGSAGFVSDGKPVQVLDSSVYLFNSLEPLGIRIFAHENTGYHLMSDNVEIMKKVYKEQSSTFFPLNTEHNLINYLNILPFNGRDIRYKLRNGFSDENLKILWDRYLRRFM
jgi:hypothetical protein